MLNQAQWRDGTDSNLPIIKRNKLKLKAFGYGTQWSPVQLQATSSLLLQMYVLGDTALMEAHISEWMSLKITEKHRAKGK